MAKQVTVLEGIIGDVAIALYQKWYNAMPAEEKNEVAEEALKRMHRKLLYSLSKCLWINLIRQRKN